MIADCLTNFCVFRLCHKWFLCVVLLTSGPQVDLCYVRKCARSQEFQRVFLPYSFKLAVLFSGCLMLIRSALLRDNEEYL